MSDFEKRILFKDKNFAIINKNAATKLSLLFSKREKVNKVYWAIVEGVIQSFDEYKKAEHYIYFDLKNKKHIVQMINIKNQKKPSYYGDVQGTVNVIHFWKLFYSQVELIKFVVNLPLKIYILKGI